MATQENEIVMPPKKRLKTANIKIQKPMAIVLDIEGTVISKSFYDDVLLPYSRDNIRDFLYENSDLEHIFKRIEEIKDRYFDEYPQKEALFNHYFTELAYDQYLEQIKQASIQNHTQYVQSQIHQNGVKLAVINKTHSENEQPKNILEVENTLEIVDDIRTTIVFNDNEHKNNKTNAIEIIDVSDQQNNNTTEIVDIIESDKNTKDIQVIDIVSDHNDADNNDKDEDEDIDLMDYKQDADREQNDVVHIQKNVIEIIANNKKETHATNNQEIIEITDETKTNYDNVNNANNVQKETVSGKKRKLVDIINIDDDENDDIDIIVTEQKDTVNVNKNGQNNHVIEIESDSEESVSDISVLSKTEFYRTKQIDLLMEIIEEWFDLELKIKPLQYLQGLLIDYGFKTKDIKANIYRDCYQAIVKWADEDDINVYIYSHGTKAAQKLIFKYSTFGDLDEYISGYFDKATTGNKKDTESYFNLLRDIQSDQWDNHNDESIEDDMMDRILFISDHVLELEAAQDAGLTVAQSVRDGVEACMDFDQITDFSQIQWVEIQADTVMISNGSNGSNNSKHHNGHHGS